MIGKVILWSVWLFVGPFNGWETLSKLEIVPSYDEFLGEDGEKPVFSDELLAFNGEVVELEGYVIPIEQSGASDYFVLSRYPYNACFFCGNAGPETVAEVYAEEKFNQVDEKIRVKGTLKLNSEDPFHLYFILENSEVTVL